MSHAAEQQLKGLSVLLELERAAREPREEAELAFVMVNDTHLLVPYRQAILWRRRGPGSGSVTALSGLAKVDPRAPFVIWLDALLNRWDQEASTDHGKGATRLIDPSDLSEEDRAAWAEWLPEHALWQPLGASQGALGGLLLARESPWSEAERTLLGHLAGAYGHAWGALIPSREWGGRRWPKWAATAVAAVATGFLLALPVTQTVLAPAQAVPVEPAVVRAPIEGVVAAFAVRPNRAVEENQLLLTLDDTALRSRLEVAKVALEAAKREHWQESQRAVLDREGRSPLALLQGRVEQRAAELARVEALLTQVRILSPRAGIVLFDDPNDWLGRPVAQGERILMVADPDRAELEVRLPADRAIQLPPEARALFFPNTRPDAAIAATVREAAFQPEMVPEGFLAYRLRAGFDAGEPVPRVGLRGTARLHGYPISLFDYMLGRPLAAARRMAGL